MCVDGWCRWVVVECCRAPPPSSNGDRDTHESALYTHVRQTVLTGTSTLARAAAEDEDEEKEAAGKEKEASLVTTVSRRASLRLATSFSGREGCDRCPSASHT